MDADVWRDGTQTVSARIDAASGTAGGRQKEGGKGAAAAAARGEEEEEGCENGSRPTQHSVTRKGGPSLPQNSLSLGMFLNPRHLPDI